MGKNQSSDINPNGSFDFRQRFGLFIGPVTALIFYNLIELQPDKPAVTATAAVALLMAIWWITEAVPLYVTALLPIVLFPVGGIMNGKDVSVLYFNHVIFLFIGGFLVALAMERWNLHLRIALAALRIFGVHPVRILFGFMSISAFLSMWISNTATTMMMLPIALSIIISLESVAGKENLHHYSTGLLLGIAYGASIGGIATPVGTPPNIAFMRILTVTFSDAPDISFAHWFFFALPISVTFLFIAWGLLSLLYGRVHLPIESQIFKEQYRQLDRISFEEKVVLADFSILAALWMTRADLNLGIFTLPGWAGFFNYAKYFNDGTVAILLTLPLFIIPARRGGRILEGEMIQKLPWNIILLFGGGFALAGGFAQSGLSVWLGEQLTAFGEFHPVTVVASISLLLTFLTELTSNTATAQMLLPIIASLAVAVGRNPLLFMIPATLSCSFAFMLPVATPPNAIVFGTNRVGIVDMAKTGIILNLIGAAVITSAIFLLGWIFDIDPGIIPDWSGK